MEVNTEFSFFDSKPEPGFTLWNKQLIDSHKLTKDKILCEGYLFKKCKRLTNQWAQRYYVLYNNFFVYYKSHSKTNIQGIMKLLYVRVEKILDTKNKYHGFRLMKNQQTFDVYCKDDIIAQLWGKNFRKVCINTDFHQEFEVIKPIGQGGFAKVYLAERKSDKKQFAIKALSKYKMLEQQNGRESLINEILITKSLQHPNIMTLYEVYESQSSMYLVLELMQGGELLKIITSQQEITQNQIRRITKTLLEILVYLHSKDIMHRDLKPENLIIVNKENPEHYDFKVVDFGLAAYVHEPNHLFKRCGTPGFVAPEVFTTKDGKYDTKCDIFSAGCIFHMLYTGNIPFAGLNQKEILSNNRHGKVQIDSENLLHLNTKACDMIQKMLDINPQKRPSAQDLLNHPYMLEDNDSIQNKIVIQIQGSIFNFIKKITAEKPKEQELLLKDQETTVDSHFEMRMPIINGHISTILESRRDIQSIDSPSRANQSRIQQQSQFAKSLFNNDDIISPSLKGRFGSNNDKQQNGQDAPRKFRIENANKPSDIYRYTLLKNQSEKDKIGQHKLQNSNSQKCTQECNGGANTKQSEINFKSENLFEFENLHLISNEDSPISQNIVYLNQLSVFYKISGLSIHQQILNSTQLSSDNYKTNIKTPNLRQNLKKFI